MGIQRNVVTKGEEGRVSWEKDGVACTPKVPAITNVTPIT